MSMLRCPICPENVVSRHRHDFVTCKGKHIFVDGGDAYLRFGILEAGMDAGLTLEKLQEANPNQFQPATNPSESKEVTEGGSK